jgi:hypothetical protein
VLPHPSRPHPSLPLTRQRELVADLLGLGAATWQPLADATTAAVYRVVEHRLVVRFSQTPTRVAPLVAHVERATALVAAGVPFALPAVGEPLTYIDPHVEDSPVGAATVWHDLGPSRPADYEQFGHTLRLLHDDGTRALVDDTGLRVVSDFDHMRMRLDRAGLLGVITREEHDLLSPWVERMENLHPGHPRDSSGAPADDGEVVLVHDDVWPKNLIQTAHGAHLLDPDNLAWGTRAHDLAFLARAQDNGSIDLDTLVQFERGYGEQVPSPNTAWTHAYVHRMRWVLDLIESRHLPEPQRMLAIELPLWALPRGPRDHPSL